MPEKTPNRPKGAQGTDFRELNDWTVMDIATTPQVRPDDEANARAEIARRKQEGTFDPDNAPHEVRRDFAEHGYGVHDGQVLYPTKAYKEWLGSDRTTPPPESQNKETLAERRIADNIERQEEYEREQRRARGAGAIESLIDRYYDEEGEPNRQKIRHKERRPYSAEQPRSTDRSEKVKSPEERSDSLFNFYQSSFSKLVPKWISRGVALSLERGIISMPNDAIIRSGFSIAEDERVHSRIDPDDTFSPDSAAYEGELKRRVMREIIDQANIDSLRADQVESGIRQGITHAIEVGAYINERNGEIVYSLPIDKSEELLDYMQRNNMELESASTQFSSQVGFANIIDVIKGDDEAREKGYKVLDWYFDTFKYKDHFEEFEKFMDGFQEFAEPAWGQEYALYMEHLFNRLSEIDSDRKTSPEIDSVDKLTWEKLRDEYDKLLQARTMDPKKYVKERRRRLGIGSGNSGGTRNAPPSSREKYGKFFDECQKIKAIDPLADVYAITLREGSGVSKDYRAVRLGDVEGGNNVVILIPIEEASADSSYVWVGQTGEDGDAWLKDFEPVNGLSSKEVASRNARIKSHRHRASAKRGLSATDNMWRNIYKDIEERTALKIS